MNNLHTIKTEESSYIAVPVQKNSKSHELKQLSAFEGYIYYQGASGSVVYTPYVLQVNAEIIGLASSISESFKTLLIKNNLLLKEWSLTPVTSTKVHDELLIIELPDEEPE